MDREGELLDLVCGPASPLPETHQRYRLVQHIATGGQAEVYRAVRLSGGISSAPVTVKVFRLGDRRPRADQLRSWDKGDAVLMDLNSRGVPGICRRADGFYGPRPHPPGAKPKGDPEPYQVLDYLQGINLHEYVLEHRQADPAQRRPPGAALDAVGALDTLIRVLLALHHPNEPSASPVVHMDIKPSNVMVLPSGEVRLIDFTGARYHRADHMTSIAYTVEAGGPEAFSGTVGPAYDVHGFGAVAYYMVTGVFPRAESPQQQPGGPLTPWAALRRNPVLDAAPALRDHLLAPLADRPEDRPGTEELTSWVAHLADLVERFDTPDHGMFWSSAQSARVVGRAGVRAGQVTPAGDGAWHRIERLEQEVVELRSALADQPTTAGEPVTRPVSAPIPTPVPTPMSAAATQRTPMAAGTGQPTALAPVAANGSGGTRMMPNDRSEQPPGMRGVAAVPPPPPRRSDDDEYAPGRPDDREPPRPLPGARIDTLRRGMGISVTCALFAFVCWGIWALSNRGGFTGSALMFLFVLVVGVGLFALCRLLGRLVFERWLRRIRSSARLSHLAVGIYLVASGVSFASRVDSIHALYEFIYQHL